MSTPRRRALLSASQKTAALVEYAESLHTDHGFKIFASGGTASFLAENGILVTDVASLTGFGPALGHRVVTLDPRIHGGLLATDDMVSELDALGWPRWDLLHVDFYDLAGAIEKETRGPAALPDLLQHVDIGGPAMVRSAVKGGHTIVTTNQKQFPGILRWMADGMRDRESVMLALRGRAELAVAKYIMLSAKVYSDTCDLSAGGQYGL